MTSRREKQTLIPPFDPGALARDLETSDDRPTSPPPFDAASYARDVDSALARDEESGLAENVGDEESAATLGRAMYGSYLESDYPAALVFAERVLAREPEHALAKLVIDGCNERLGTSARPARLVPSSIVRMRRSPLAHADLERIQSDALSLRVLGQIDGVSDVARLATLSGIPSDETLDRVHALLDLGVLEVVNG